MMRHLRQALDIAGGRNKILGVAGDGSFCNRTCLRAPRDRTELLVRTRKDAVLCRQAPAGSRRFYDTHKFTPEQVRQPPRSSMGASAARCTPRGKGGLGGFGEALTAICQLPFSALPPVEPPQFSFDARPSRASADFNVRRRPRRGTAAPEQRRELRPTGEL